MAATCPEPAPGGQGSCSSARSSSRGALLVHSLADESLPRAEIIQVAAGPLWHGSIAAGRRPHVGDLWPAPAAGGGRAAGSRVTPAASTAARSRPTSKLSAAEASCPAPSVVW